MEWDPIQDRVRLGKVVQLVVCSNPDFTLLSALRIFGHTTADVSENCALRIASGDPSVGEKTIRKMLRGVDKHDFYWEPFDEYSAMKEEDLPRPSRLVHREVKDLWA